MDSFKSMDYPIQFGQNHIHLRRSSREHCPSTKMQESKQIQIEKQGNLTYFEEWKVQRSLLKELPPELTHSITTVFLAVQKKRQKANEIILGIQNPRFLIHKINSILANGRKAFSVIRENLRTPVDIRVRQPGSESLITQPRLKWNRKSRVVQSWGTNKNNKRLLRWIISHQDFVQYYHPQTFTQFYLKHAQFIQRRYPFLSTSKAVHNKCKEQFQSVENQKKTEISKDNRNQQARSVYQAVQQILNILSEIEEQLPSYRSIIKASFQRVRNKKVYSIEKEKNCFKILGNYVDTLIELSLLFLIRGFNQTAIIFILHGWDKTFLNLLPQNREILKKCGHSTLKILQSISSCKQNRLFQDLPIPNDSGGFTSNQLINQCFPLMTESRQKIVILQDYISVIEILYEEALGSQKVIKIVESSQFSPEKVQQDEIRENYLFQVQLLQQAQRAFQACQQKKEKTSRFDDKNDNNLLIYDMPQLEKNTQKLHRIIIHNADKNQSPRIGIVRKLISKNKNAKSTKIMKHSYNIQQETTASNRSVSQNENTEHQFLNLF